jgi:hypothetical protein
MPQGDWYILMIVGGVFIVLGIIGIIWGRYEEKRIFDALAQQPDLREFTLKHVESPQPGALKTGGWIAIALGGLMLAVGIVFWLLAGS